MEQVTEFELFHPESPLWSNAITVIMLPFIEQVLCDSVLHILFLTHTAVCQLGIIILTLQIRKLRFGEHVSK